MNDADTQCLKITEKVLFNIAWKLVDNAKIKTLKCDIWDDFQTLCS